MTVSVQTPYTATEANGSTTVFPYQFKINDSDDLEVTLDGVVQTTGFTVSGVGDNLGGDVTFSVAPAAGVAVLLARNPVLDRATDYAQFGKLQADILDADIDRIWLALQKFANDFNRSLKLPVDTATDQLIDSTPGERANALVSFDSNGNLTITPLTSIAVSVLAGSFTVDTFSGTGAQTAFTLTRDPGILNNTTVFVDGAYIRKDQYSISGTTLTFDVAPASGTSNIEVCQSVALEAGSPADGTVTLASLIDGVLAASAAGLAKMGDGFLAASTAGRLKMADKFVTLAKMNDMATGKLLGNVSGVTGAPDEVSEASQAEAEAGALQTRWMSPLRTAQAIAALAIIQGTSVPTTSGVSVEFLSVPAGQKRILISLSGVGTNGTSPKLIQIGSGSFASSGYSSSSQMVQEATGFAGTYSTAGFVIHSVLAADRLHGSMLLTLVDEATNTWSAFGCFRNSANQTCYCAGSVALAGELDRINITTVGGANTYAAGLANIQIGGMP